MKDCLVKAVTGDGSLRASAALTTAVVQQARDSHGLLPLATAALGRLMTGALLMAADFKGKERINLRVEGNGPLGRLMADAGLGEVRGYVDNPAADLPPNAAGKINVGGGIGTGMLHVVKDLALKEPWRSSVPLVSGEIGEDLTWYLTHSEQIPSAVGLGVVVTPAARVTVAGGFLVQVLPGCPPGHLDAVEARITAITSVTDLLVAHGGPEQMLHWLLDGFSPHLYPPTAVTYRCRCSRDRMARGLISLGKEELSQFLEQQQMETWCHFCNKRYTFSREDIRCMLNN